MSNLHAELNSFNDSGFAQGRKKTNETFFELTGPSGYILREDVPLF